MRHFLKMAVLGILAGSMSLSLASCGFDLGTTTPFLYDDAEKYSVGGGEVTADGLENLHISWVSGDVKVTVGDTETVRFNEECEENLRDKAKLRYLNENGTLTIQFCASAKALRVKNKKTLTVELPKALAQNMKDVKIHIVSSDLTMDKITAEDIDLESVSGEISIENTKANSMKINTVSGEAEVEGVFDDVNLDSVSGDLELTLPTDAGFTAELKSVSGDFSSDVATTSKDGVYTAGDGKMSIACNTVSGDLKIKEK